MENEIMKCIDAGSEYCPCYLSETGSCLTCSRLQGRDVCDCDWTGVCIYNEYIFNGGSKAAPRRDMKCRIVFREEILEDYIVFEVEADKGFVLRCLRPGSYVFMRNSESERFYDVPLSLLAADYAKGTVSVGMRLISAKTRSLNDSGEYVTVRGPYRNGIIGLDGDMRNRKVLIIARGSGVSPAVFAYNLFKRNNAVDILLNDGELEKKLLMYINEDAGPESANIMIRNLDDADERERVSLMLKGKGYDDILVLGSDGFIESFRGLYKEIKESAGIAFSNNAVSCCGEGVCGACARLNKNGRRIPVCKCANREWYG